MRRAEPKHEMYDSKKGRTDSVNGKDRVKIQKNPKKPKKTQPKKTRQGLGQNTEDLA